MRYVCLIEYTAWRNFINFIEKFREACQISDNIISDHFVDVNRMVLFGSVVERTNEDPRLTRWPAITSPKITIPL